MAATEVEIGFGTTVKVETAAGSGVFFEFEELKDIDYPETSVDDHEATHMKSPGGFKEYAAGLADGGELAIPMNYIPGSDTHLFIVAWRAARDRRLMQIDPGDGTLATQFTAYVKNYQRTAPVNGIREATITVKVAGDVTEVTPA